MPSERANALLMAREDSLRGLRRTGRECHECEDGEFLKDGSELICDTCQYVPSSDEPTTRDSPWEAFRADRERAKENGDRPYCVGGVPGAYWGDGEYEYSPHDGFQSPR